MRERRIHDGLALRAQRTVGRGLCGGGGSGGLRSALRGGLPLVVFQNLRAALVEPLTAAELGQRLVGLELVLLALLAEVIDHLRCQRLGSFDSDLRELRADAGGSECGVPLGMDLGRGNVELVA